MSWLVNAAVFAMCSWGSWAWLADIEDTDTASAIIGQVAMAVICSIGATGAFLRLVS